MFQCKMGYCINEDGTPPERCRSNIKYQIEKCKECPDYNYVCDLINQAIESAKCRIYRLKVNTPNSSTKDHQTKAKNQQELMEITIKALEYYRDEMQ